ncbi:MAG: hypothetical protein HND57_08155 [Planctomycetes bacterium]|nr:hypothetical protein [Planctomycetota bacterium]
MRTHINGAWHDVNAYDRLDLTPGTTIEGPALVLEAHATTIVQRDWSVRIDQAGAIVLTHQSAADLISLKSDESCGRVPSGDIGPVELELFTCRFESLAEEMGEMLRRTAVSVNVKERLDFSCALLDADGEIVANAKHIPVHLGSLGLCVRTVRDTVNIERGDIIITNHPAYGGSHLPDVTVITPVFDSDGATRLGYVASRAHHAEIGGIAPGSMPPAAESLLEEGVIIPPMHLARAGNEPDWQHIQHLLTSGDSPTRSVHENLADMAAAVAANHRGATTLQRLASQHGSHKLRAAMKALKSKSAQCVRTALSAHADGRFEAVERLDCGTVIQVAIDIQGDSAIFGFTGTGDTHPGNLNATPAIVHSAIIYVLRLLINEPLPLNEGFMEPLEVVLPEGCLLNPVFDRTNPTACPAVAGGNVETSQRLVDTLIKALGLAACSQGTMNNVIFGNENFGYYETICGGSGAGPTCDGADAVHTHMTNTCITDPEVVEHRYPARIERFQIREGSGGLGQHIGGNGVIREFRFLEPVSLSLLTQHRVAGPYGMAGGQAGQAGVQYVTRGGDNDDSGQRIELSSIDGCDLNAGDRFTLMTPGGGGWGQVGNGEEDGFPRARE